MTDTPDETHPRVHHNAVLSEDGFSLVRMPRWNQFHDNQDELIAIHDCYHSRQAERVFVCMPVCEPCNFCGRVAPEKIQTLMILHNGHY